MTLGSLAVFAFAVSLFYGRLVSSNVVVRWDDWTNCTRLCGGKGSQYRVKYCDDGTGEVECDRVTNPCGSTSCRNKISMQPWTECSVTCGGGTRSRTYRRNKQTIACNTQPCEDPKDCPTDFTLVLDSSGSIGELNWWKQKQFVVDFLSTFKISPTSTRIGSVTFGSKSILNFALDKYDDIQLVIDHIWRIDFMHSGTNTASGLLEMKRMIMAKRRLLVSQIAILITDGRANTNTQNTIPYARDAKNEDIIIIALGIKNYKLSELTAISSGSKYVTLISNFNNLASVTGTIGDITCNLANDQLKVDCSKCDFSNGQGWRPDPKNCHNFYVCVKNADRTFTSIRFVCPANLYWTQAIKACGSRAAPTDGSCLDRPVKVTTVITTTTQVAPCPYKVNQVDNTKFSVDGLAPFQTCRTPGYFDDSNHYCMCIFTGSTSCDDTMLLHFPFDNHLNDVTCNKAISSKYGQGSVTLVNDLDRGTVASFDNGYLEVPFLRGYFAGEQVTSFSVCLYYKYTTVDGVKHVLTSNGDCDEDHSFELGTAPDSATNMLSYSDIATATGSSGTLNSQDTPNKWHLSCMVYDGSNMKFYLDKVPQNSLPATGPMANTDVPMSIGGKCGKLLFTGLIDAVKVYTRALTQADINLL